MLGRSAWQRTFVERTWRPRKAPVFKDLQSVSTQLSSGCPSTLLQTSQATCLLSFSSIAQEVFSSLYAQFLKPKTCRAPWLVCACLNATFVRVLLLCTWSIPRTWTFFLSTYIYMPACFIFPRLGTLFRCPFLSACLAYSLSTVSFAFSFRPTCTVLGGVGGNLPPGGASGETHKHHQNTLHAPIRQCTVPQPQVAKWARRARVRPETGLKVLATKVRSCVRSARTP